MSTPGYAGKILRVDLSRGTVTSEAEDPAVLRKYVGGMTLGAKILYDEVAPGTGWSDPENRLMILSGPLGGTRAMGSGTICVVTKGPMTDGSTSSQANGFLGAYLKFCGFDGIIIEGRAPQLSYLYVSDTGVEIRPSAHLAGKTVWDTEDTIKAELGFDARGMSVFGIGPAGENLVRFAVIMGDRCHTAGHNGNGAVMGSKNLKAIAVARGKQTVPVYDDAALVAGRNDMLANAREGLSFKQGTLWIMKRNGPICRTPYLNESTDVYPMTPEQLNTFTYDYLMANLKVKPHPCWACSANHAQIVQIPDGPLAGKEGKMPEYECFAALGTELGYYEGLPLVGLSNEVDRLGMDINETGWVLGLVMECYEKGILSKADTGGIEMRWGNLPAIREMLYMIAARKGFGNILAEGAMRAARTIGGRAPEFAIHTMAGNTPRTHDHRRVWTYVVDNCTSSTGSSEANVTTSPPDIGVPDVSDQFDAKQVGAFVGRIKGISPFFDCLGICKFPNSELPGVITRMVNAATGWNMTWTEALDVGLRSVNLLRAFNMRHGYSVELDAPSPRYGGLVTEGLGKGKSANAVWKEMRDVCYGELGWDAATGKPKPETLKKLGLDSVTSDLWGTQPGN